MKINEIAVITESHELEEAPIGLLRRMGTALKGMFSASQAQESKVQSAVNSLYKEYKTYYTATPAQRATGQNLLDFLKGSGYPIGPKAPKTGFKTLTDVANAAEEAEKLKNAKPQQAEPETEPEQDNGGNQDNTIDFNKVKQNSPEQNYRDGYDQIFKQGMYEAVDIKADTPLNDDMVKKIIEFVVRHSYATDTIKDLKPGSFTNKARTQRNKELAQQAKEKLGLTQDKDGVWSVVSAGVEYTDAPVTEGIMKFKGADGKVVSIPIASDQPTLQDLQKAQQKYGAPQTEPEEEPSKEKEPTNISGNIARGLKMGYKAGSDPLGTLGKAVSDKFDDLAKSAGDKDDGSDEKMTKQGVNFMKSELGLDNPNMAVKALQKLVKGDPISNAKEREAVAPIINAVVKSLQDQNGRTRLKTLFKSVN